MTTTLTSESPQRLSTNRRKDASLDISTKSVSKTSSGIAHTSTGPYSSKPTISTTEEDGKILSSSSSFTPETLPARSTMSQNEVGSNNPSLTHDSHFDVTTQHLTNDIQSPDLEYLTTESPQTIREETTLKTSVDHTHFESTHTTDQQPTEDHCLNVQCQNGGTCLSKADGYSCTCYPEFQGFQCELGMYRMHIILINIED